MIAPHTSCRYVVGIAWPPEAFRDVDHPPRTFIGAVHAIFQTPGEHTWQVLASRVDDYDRPGEDPMTIYAMPRLLPFSSLAGMAPNLGEARKALRAMLAAGPQ